MRITWLRLVTLSVFLTFAASGVAWAHVVVSPEEAPAGEFQRFVVSVPTEKDIPTTGIRVEVPEGFTVASVQPVQGWEYEFEEEGGIIEAITWSGGEIDPREFQEFAFQARTPEEPGEYAWNAFQTYEDGSVVEWTGPPDAEEEPASVVEVVSGGAQTNEPGVETQGSNPVVSYFGLGLGVLALVLALVALVVALRRTRKP